MRRKRSESSHHGSAVHKRETFLALQHHRRETDTFQRFFRGKPFTIQSRIAIAHKQSCHVRQRDKIATRAD